jgi:hypothetical protein
MPLSKPGSSIIHPAARRERRSFLLGGPVIVASVVMIHPATEAASWGFAPPVVGSFKIATFGTNIVRAGLNWRFGGFGVGPAVASY